MNVWTDAAETMLKLQENYQLQKRGLPKKLCQKIYMWTDTAKPMLKLFEKYSFMQLIMCNEYRYQGDMPLFKCVAVVGEGGEGRSY